MGNVVSAKIVREICPICHGIGKKVHPRYRKQDPDCFLCEGRGWVTPIVCMGCGRPAFLYKAPTPYCGREDCLKMLVRIRKRKQGQAPPTFGGAMKKMQGFHPGPVMDMGEYAKGWQRYEAAVMRAMNEGMEGRDW